MRRNGHCATMAMGPLALKGLGPNLCAKCHSRETNRKIRAAISDRGPASFQIFSGFPVRQILTNAIGPGPF
jgi:hypothetical protein